MRKHLSFLLLAAFALSALAQTPASPPAEGEKPKKEKKKKEKKPKKEKPITVAFYNLENLFDYENDPKINDEEFLPDGANHWGQKEYAKKLDNMAKVIAQLGDEDGPEVLGLAEVENLRVLQDLVASPRLRKHGYKIVHHDSPDERGIDVALIYKDKAFKFLYDQLYPVLIPGDTSFHTRDILLVKGIIAKDQELCIMVNHWPSRRGGAEKSAPFRAIAASTARAVVDSIMDLNRDANMAIMGDFNDEPTDKSITDSLKASYDVKGSFGTYLYNPMRELQAKGDGSLMYNKEWDMFDQIILSTSLVNGSNSLFYKWQSAAVYRPEWMQVTEEGDWKTAPRRSILKNKLQENGYSDHFPVYVTLLKR